MTSTSKKEKTLVSRAQRLKRISNCLMRGALILTTAVQLVFMLPDFVFSESGIKPTGETRMTAGIMLIIVATLALVIRSQGQTSTSQAFRLRQKVEFWGGAAGVFILFTIGENLKDQALYGILGSFGLIILLLAAVMLEPWILELENFEQAAAEKRMKNQHKEVIAALTALRELRVEGSGSDNVGGFWKRLINRKDRKL